MDEDISAHSDNQLVSEPRTENENNEINYDATTRNAPTEAVGAVPQPPPAVARLQVEEEPDWRQRTLRQFSLQRSDESSASRTGRASSASMSSHQSQLRKQAHIAAPTSRILNPGGLRSVSLGSLSTRHRDAPSNVPLIEIPRASYPGRAAPMPAAFAGPMPAALDGSAVASSPPLHTNSGWSLVRTTQGTAGGAPPCERSLHAAAVLNGCMYVFGGYDGLTRVNDFHAYSFAERRWSPVLPSANSGRPPSPRDRHVAVTYGNSFYVFGGFDGTSRVSDFFGFDFSSMTWREVISTSGRPPSPRHSHAAVVYGNSMFVFGGYDGSYKSDLHEFEFNLSKWSPVTAAGRRPRPRYRGTCVVHKNSMLLFGGHDGTRHLADTHVFDFETRIWSTLVTEGTPPIPRDSHVSVVHGNSMYIFGGSSGSAMNDLHELQLPPNATSAAKWRPIKANGTDQPGHRFCHVGVVHMDAMYIFGGYDGSDRLNDFIRFDFAVYDLSFEVPPSTMISDFRVLVNDETLSDITFIVEDQPVYAHKLMLMRCSYFRALFFGDMRESTQSIIHIEQVSHSVFLSVLEYLYTDSIAIPLESAMEIFEAADLFCIPRLMTMCEKRMLQSITVDNAATIFHAADLHSATALREKSLKFILSHFEDVSKTTSFEEMGRGNMELVFEVLRNR